MPHRGINTSPLVHLRRCYRPGNWSDLGEGCLLPVKYQPFHQPSLQIQPEATAAVPRTAYRKRKGELSSTQHSTCWATRAIAPCAQASGRDPCCWLVVALVTGLVAAADTSGGGSGNQILISPSWVPVASIGEAVAPAPHAMHDILLPRACANDSCSRSPESRLNTRI